MVTWSENRYVVVKSLLSPLSEAHPGTLPHAT